ncbi:MAG: thymidylate synthase [archaeon]
MKPVTIGKDHFLKRDIKKMHYSPDEIPKVQLFSSSDVIMGNPSSNLAIGIVYTWKEDRPPTEVSEFVQKISNYAAMTGYWRTTNGAKYVFANILANPNINKLILLVFQYKDNGHLLVDALSNFWEKGLDENNIIKNSKAPNPKFEQVTDDGLARIKKQCDLLVIRKIAKSDFPEIEKILNHAIDYPTNNLALQKIKLDYSFSSSVIKNNLLYDDGARFDLPLYMDLSTSAKKIVFEKKEISKTLGQGVQADNLEDALDMIATFVFQNGTMLSDQRNIITCENRTLTLTINNPLEKIPAGFSKEYIKKYVEEFMEGKGSSLDEFVYTYHDRIFVKWGNQAEKIVELLKRAPNTRRALISLWDQRSDVGNSNAPCLIFLWFAIRDNVLEVHAVYRSHHLATVTKDGKIMEGEGALVPNLYAIATLQKEIAKKIEVKPGPLVLTDLSGHVYVSEV